MEEKKPAFYYYKNNSNSSDYDFMKKYNNCIIWWAKMELLCSLLRTKVLIYLPKNSRTLIYELILIKISINANIMKTHIFFLSNEV